MRSVFNAESLHIIAAESITIKSVVQTTLTALWKPILLTRVGKMVKASNNSYRWVYKNDGTYHYPKIENNIMRVKGKQYFTLVDLTGSKEGTAKNPKMSLISAYKNGIITAMDLSSKKIMQYHITVLHTRDGNKMNLTRETGSFSINLHNLLF